MFAFSKVHIKMAFKQANAYLRRPDVKERTVGMAFFTEVRLGSQLWGADSLSRGLKVPWHQQHPFLVVQVRKTYQSLVAIYA